MSLYFKGCRIHGEQYFESVHPSFNQVALNHKVHHQKITYPTGIIVNSENWRLENDILNWHILEYILYIYHNIEYMRKNI